jgi:hypothetical protein
MVVSPGITLIHSAASALGEQAFRARQTARIKGHGRTKASGDGFEFSHQAESDCLQDLLSLIRELVAAGSSLHGSTGRYSGIHALRTPLTAIIVSFSHLSNLCLYTKGGNPLPQKEFFDLPIPAVTDVYIPLIMWLELLYEGGINLVDYGRKENQLLQEGQTMSLFYFTVRRRPIGSGRGAFGGFKAFSLSFNYGPKPSDWQFWLIEQMDDSFAEFWDMIDHPERAMPGSWDDRFDDYE